jgi:hypothetical protein
MLYMHRNCFLHGFHAPQFTVEISVVFILVLNERLSDYLNCYFNLSFEVLALVIVHVVIFWVVTSCSIISR